MGAEGFPLTAYDSYADFEFIDPLYDYGAAIILLTGLDGNAAPQPGWIVKIVWDYLEADEQTHWQGFISQADTKQEGNVYAIRAFTMDGRFHINQTGAIRKWVGYTPDAIVRAGFGPPHDLRYNAQTAPIMLSGAAAGVPNKVNGLNPGTALANFVADSTTLLNNIKRLCMQARYGDGSYGLEWTTTLEGANGSSSRFYLVKRRERSSGYTPEVFAIPDDLTNVRRGAGTFPGVDFVKVVGAGDGQSRVESAIAGAGTREAIVVDKAIIADTFGTPSTSVNADNMAQRIVDISSNAIEIIHAEHFRHASPTRTGDTITVTQAGYADANLRVMMRHYNLQNKSFTFLIGRPASNARNAFQAMKGLQGTDTSSPQTTDLIVPSQYPSGLNLLNIPFGGATPQNVPAGVALAGVPVPAGVGFTGDCEGYLAVCQLVVDVTHAARNGGTVELLLSFDFSSNPGVYQAISVVSFGEPGIGTGVPAQDTNQQYTVYPFKVNHPVSGDTTILNGKVTVRNRGAAGVIIDTVNTKIAVFLRPKHRHNEF